MKIVIKHILGSIKLLIERIFRIKIIPNSYESKFSRYVSDEPIDLNAFDIFSESWSTIYKDEAGDLLTEGKFDGTNDARIDWLTSKIDFSGMNVLELGPLEAAHTLMLERAGANILSVEGNVGAFLRCLIVKNDRDLKSKFLLGDFNKFEAQKNEFDLVLASGVLYHMSEPVKFLEKFSKFSDKLFLWTHYFDEDLSKWHPDPKRKLTKGKWNYKDPEIVNYDGLDVKLIKQHYGRSLGWDGFCGGPEKYSYWIEKNDLLALLKKLGYSQIDISFDEVAHENGPSFCLLAQK